MPNTATLMPIARIRDPGGAWPAGEGALKADLDLAAMVSA